MKLNYFLSLCLLSLIGILLSVPIRGEKIAKSPQLLSVRKNRKNEKNVLQSTIQCSNVILASDISDTGFILPHGGNWCLGEDVSYFPDEENPAILIPASAENVILDLNGHTLKYGGDSTNLGIIGIVVERAAKNVTIKNGTIRDFTFAAINAGAQDSDFITGLTLSGLNILHNGSAIDASQMGGINLFNIRDIVLENSNFRENFLAGLRGINTFKLTIDNCHFDDNLPGSESSGFVQSMHGANLSAATDTVIRNSTFNNNLGNGQSIGLFMDKVNTLLIHSCQCNSNKLDARAIIFSANNGGSLYGAKLTGTGITIHNSQFNDNTAEFNEGEFDGNFFQIDIEGANINAHTLTIDNSEFCNTRVTARVPLRGNSGAAKLHAAGLDHVSSTNVKVSHSTFSGQRNSNENVGFALHQVAYGTVSFQSNSIVYTNCTSDDNRSIRMNEAETQIFSIGHCHQLLTNGTFKDCRSRNNQHAGGTSQAIAAGYLVTNSTIGDGNIVFKDCIGQDNSDSADNVAGIAAGFITSNLGRDDSVGTTLAQNYFLDGCVAQRNTSIGNAAGIYFGNIINSQVSNSTASRNTVGILIESGSSRSNIINNNTVSNNTRLGIADLSNTEDNAYYSNRALNNGNDPIRTNYFSVPSTFLPLVGCGGVQSGTPMRLWRIDLAPCNLNNDRARGEILDNMNMIRKPIGD